MFHSLALCSVRDVAVPARRTAFGVAPGLIGRRLLPASAAPGFAALAVAVLVLVAGVATLPRGVLSPGAGVAETVLTLRGDSPSGLRDQAEAVRARLLGTPGVGAVTITGLHQQRLAVEYVPRRLLALGVTAAELAAAVPVDVSGSWSGHLALRTDAGLDGPADAAALPVRSGKRVFRLGDVALVTRAKLEPPVSVLAVGGLPAVRLTIVPTR